MTVRSKTLLIIGLVLAIVLGALCAGARLVLLEQFLGVERVQAQARGIHAMQRLSDSAERLNVLCAGYAAVPGAFENGAPASLKLLAEAIDSGCVGVFADGKTVHATTFENGIASPGFMEGLSAYLQENGLLGPGAANRAGVVVLPSGPMIVSVWNAPENKKRCVVVARTLAAEQFITLANFRMSLAPHPATSLGSNAAVTGLPNAHAAAEVSLEAAICRCTFSDLSGKNTIEMSSADRPLSVEQAESASRMLAVSLLTALAVTTGLTMLLLSQLVLNPLKDLAGQIREVRAGKRIRLTVHSGDEVGQVAKAMNETLGTLDSSRRRLAESEASFRSMIDNAPIGVFLCDADGACILINAQSEKILGKTSAAIYGRGWESTIHPADRERVISMWDQSCKARRTFREHHRLLHADGTVVWATSLGAPIIKDGVLMGFVGTIEDTSKRLESEKALREATKAAQAANLAKSEFLASMSHEIRTPMTAILGLCELMGEKDQTDEDRQSCLQTVRRNGEHLMAIINDILDLSKIEAGQAVVERMDCEPARVLAEVVGLLEVRAREKGLSLTVDFATPIPEFITNDTTKLRQVLINLIANAVKFTQAGSIRVVARTAQARDGGTRLEVSVIDTGIGMSADQVSRLFMPFSQGDTSMARRFGGTGLGLSISQKLASLMGGEITVTSLLASGSTFTLSIDAGKVRGATLKAPVSPPQPPALSPTPPMGLMARVLLAEDGVDNQRLIMHILSRAGAHIELAENGREAVDLALRPTTSGQPPFDIILMDMQMPLLDGYAATRLLREKGYRGTIIALTAHAMAEDRAKCLAAGCDDYASKPINRATLVETCRRWATNPRMAA